MSKSSQSRSRAQRNVAWLSRPDVVATHVVRDEKDRSVELISCQYVDRLENRPKTVVECDRERAFQYRPAAPNQSARSTVRNPDASKMRIVSANQAGSVEITLPVVSSE